MGGREHVQERSRGLWVNDLAAGTTTLRCNLPYEAGVWGLDESWDGTMFAIRDGVELLRIDRHTCAVESTPLSQPVTPHYPAMAVDERGMIVVEDEILYEIDPISGLVRPSTKPPGPVGFATAEVNGNGDLFVAHYLALLERYTPADGQWTTIMSTYPMLNCSGLAFRETANGQGFEATCEGHPNSTGDHATLELIGTNQVADDDLELASRRLPLNAFGYYLTGPNSGSTMVGQGELCIATPTYRFMNNVLHSGTTGTVRMPVGLGAVPGHGLVTPGDSLVFQLWYRDGVSSNFSSAVRVTFE